VCTNIESRCLEPNEGKHGHNFEQVGTNISTCIF